MPKKDLLESRDKEESKFVIDRQEEIHRGQITLEHLLGFKIPKSTAKAIMPYILCERSVISPYALLPIYDCVFFPIYRFVRWYKNGEIYRIVDEKSFRFIHRGVNPEEIALLAEKGRLIPYFVDGYEFHDPELIEPLMQPGIPRISYWRVMALRRYNLCSYVDGDCEKCRVTIEQANKDIHLFPNPEGLDMNREQCVECLKILYGIGMRNKLVTEDGEARYNLYGLCHHTYPILSRHLSSILQSECYNFKQLLTDLSGLGLVSKLDQIVRGLKIRYTPDIGLDSYLDIIDSKTTKAIREIMRQILKDPATNINQDQLNGKIFDLNQEVEHLAKSKAGRVFEAVSDIAIYGGKKYLERLSNNYLKIPEKGLHALAEWITSKGLDAYVKLTGTDWAIAQLYKARCKLEKCKS